MKTSELATRIYEKSERVARDIWLIDCPYCGDQSYYDGGFTCGCEHCGKSIAQFSDAAYSLEDSWDMQVVVP